MTTNPFHYGYDFRRPRLDNRTYQSHNAYESLYHMGKIDPPPYNNRNVMAEHYSSRVDRYTPVHGSLYSNNIAQQPHTQTTRVYATNQSGNVGPKNTSSVAINTDRYSNRDESNRSVKSRSSSMSVPSNNSNNLPQQGRNSILSTYGSNSLPANQASNYELPSSNKYQSPSNYHPPARSKPSPQTQEINVFQPQLHETSKVFSKQQKPYNIVNLYSRHPEPLKKFPKLTKEHILQERGMDFPN